VKCFACGNKALVTDSHVLRMEGWHDISGSVAPETVGDDAFWLCPRCTRGTVQCSRCGLRTDATAARTGHGAWRDGTPLNIKPWTCVGELWEWLCDSCTQPN